VGEEKGNRDQIFGSARPSKRKRKAKKQKKRGKESLIKKVGEQAKILPKKNRTKFRGGGKKAKNGEAALNRHSFYGFTYLWRPGERTKMCEKRRASKKHVSKKKKEEREVSGP